MIDLRSDTVTKPSEAMRRAIAEAEVGDDVFGEDPTVIRLQEHVAALLNKEAALFVPSGTMANQVCINAQTQPGDEIICDEGAHIINFESGALAKLSGVQAKTIRGKNGVFSTEQLKTAIRPAAYYFPHSQLVAIENSHNLAGGTIFPRDEIGKIADFCAEHRLKMHLDGARLWNASIASDVSFADYAKPFDSVSVCLSKGLGAPAGSLVAGSKEFIERAHLSRKQFGGGMRQAGILAAAGLYALENNLERLEEDHRNARLLAEIVADCPRLKVDLPSVQTNIVIMELADGDSAAQVCSELEAKGVKIVPMGAHTLRAVTHCDVRKEDVLEAAIIITRNFNR